MQRQLTQAEHAAQAKINQEKFDDCAGKLDKAATTLLSQCGGVSLSSTKPSAASTACLIAQRGFWSEVKTCLRTLSTANNHAALSVGEHVATPNFTSVK